MSTKPPLLPRSGSRTSPPSLTEIETKGLVVDSASGDLVGGESVGLVLSAGSSSAIPEAAVRLFAEVQADLLASTQTVADLTVRIREISQRNRRLVEERDRATAQILPIGSGVPERLAFYCDGKDCTAALAVRPPPTDDAIIWAIFVAARWIVVPARAGHVDDDHYCSACAKMKGLV